MKKPRDIVATISYVGLAFATVLMLALSLYNIQIIEIFDENIKMINDILDTITPLKEIEERHIIFTDNKGHEWTVPIEVTLDAYNHYRSHGVLKKIDSYYICEKLDVEEIRKIVSQIKALANEAGYNDEELLYMYIRLVQSIKYVDKKDYCTANQKGCIKYIKNPIVTLYDGTGDSEDTAYTLTAILHEAGYDTAIVNFPEHIMCAIAGEFNSGSYFTLCGSDTKYYYIETTGHGWNIGDLPEQFHNQEHSVFVYETK